MLHRAHIVCQLLRPRCLMYFLTGAAGGEGGIRTLARLSAPIPLAGEPLMASWVPLHILTLFRGL